ncbi:MAG: hypothetical protein IIZ92_10135 [Aquincola sp.]|nr:hypothetical protein [Aquincola sp.]
MTQRKPAAKTAKPAQGRAEKPAPSEAKRAVVDWDHIEIDYRAGIKSLRQMGEEYGVSHVAITKRAKAKGWTRDLSKRIAAKAEAKVNAAAVNSVVTAERLVTEQVVVEANAEMQSRIRLAHRTDIQRARGLCMRLLEELDAETGAIELLQDLGELMRRENENGVDRLNDLYHKVIALPGRIKGMKDLGETLRVLIGLEREAFGIAAVTTEPETPKSAAPNPSDARAYYAWLTQQSA